MPQHLLELEKSGCTVWQLTRDNLNDIDDVIDDDNIYAKGFFESVNEEITLTGLRIGTGAKRMIAHFGDWIVRDPAGRWVVYPYSETVVTN